jgi:RHS repeat-associated protein
VKFTGGRFVTADDAAQYVGGDSFPQCESSTIGWQFPPEGATAVNITLANTGFRDDQKVRMQVTDLVDGRIVTTTTERAFPKQGSINLTAAGEGITLLSVTVTNEFGTPVQGFEASWSVTAMDVVQPVWPSVDLFVSRNGNGTFSASIIYTFPSQSMPADRYISLSIPPSGEEPGVDYPITETLSDSGTIVKQLGTFDTDRMLRATATACGTTASAEASIDCNQCKGPATSVGGPVRLFDGVMTYTDVDPLPATIGSEFRREYSSGAAADGRFGKGWSSMFDASAVPIDAENKTVAVVNEDRSRSVFRLLATGKWKQSWPEGGLAGTFAGSEATGYTLRDAGGSIVRSYGSNHRLIRVQDLRRDRAISITYDGAGNPTRIFDETGNWSCTLTTANAHVVGVAVDGRPDLAWTYGYSGSLLTSVTVAGASSPWRTYEYIGNRMTVVRDASGSAIERHDYDSLGRATSSYDASGDLTNIQYPASDAGGVATTTVTRADNSQATYEQAFAAGGVVTRHADGGCTSCGANDATAAYDNRGNLVRLQDGRGYITRTSYDLDGRHVLSITTAMKPAGCNPATDPARCRLSSDALGAATLDQMAASQTTTYEFADANWADRPTRITRASVIQPAGTSSEAFTFDGATGETLVHSMTGAIDTAGTQETHLTTTALYGTGEPAAFNPGGAFQTAWLSLPQPLGKKKSVDGPRTDVSDLTSLVYYPLDNAVPGAWRGQLAAVKNALGHISRYEDYDVFGHAATIVDPNGVITRLTFDALGRLATSTLAGMAGCDTSADPLCATDLTTTRTYAGTGGLLVSERRAAGNTTTYAYDTRGRLQTLSRGTSTAALERMEYSYDPTSGKKSSEVVSAFENGAWVGKKSETYTYTSTGELASVVHPDTTRMLYAYLPDGALASTQDENHTTPNTRYTYEAANRLASVTQTLPAAPGGQIVTRYAYDLQGNLTSVTDPNGNVTTYTFDDFGRMRRQVSPVSGTTTYGYDFAGNVLTTVDANGATITRAYDALNRITSSASTRGAATETVAWGYDDASAGNFGVGRLATLADPTGSTAYRYERRGLLRSEAKTIAGGAYTTTYAYDANGNRSTLTYPTGLAARYTFDFADRPLSLMAGATTIVSGATYLPFGPLTGLTFGNGTTRTVQFDPRYRPLENKLTGPAGTIAQYTYAEDNVGNITQIHDATDPRYNRDFGYDDLNRLTTANSGALLWGSGSYTYDAMGNMLTSALGTWKSTSASLVGTTPKLGAVVENGSSRSVGYDGAGNETLVGSEAFAYSPRNQLASANTASYLYDGRNVLTIATVSILSVSVAPANVTGGGVATGTVTLSAPAAADTTVMLSSSNPAAGAVPGSVVVPAGGTSTPFTVTTSPVVATTGVTLTAAFNQYSATTLLYVVPAQLSSLAISPSSVLGGNPATGTVTLSGVAAANMTVTLSSNDSAVTVPPSVTVQAGSATATFTITTTAGVANRTATITATLNGTSRTATLALTDADIASLSIAPSSVLNGGTATGTVTLNGTAASNIVVSLSSSAPDAFPATGSVTIPQGATSGNFTINTSLRSVTPKTVTITATRGAVTRQATITVTPPWLTSLTITPFPLVGGDPATGTGTLNGPAPLNAGYAVTFTSGNTSLVATPKPIAYSNVATGQTTVLTNPVTTSTPVVVTGTDSTGVSVSQTITLQPAGITLSSLSLSTSSIIGSNKLTGTVILTAVAPSGGINVDLKTSNASRAYPGILLRIPAGSQSATFSIATFLTTTNTSVTISAVHAAMTKNAVLTVQAPTAANYVTSCSLAVQKLTGGMTATGTVNMKAVVTAGGGVAVNLASSNTAVATVPATVTVKKNTQSQTFTVTTSSVTAPADVTITATSGGTTQTAKLTVLPANGVALASIAMLQPFVDQGSFWRITGTDSVTPVFGFGTVTLTGPAPAGGATVSLTGSRTNTIVINDLFGAPVTSVVVSAGATSAAFYGRMYPFTGIDRGTTFAATYAGITRAADVLVTAQPQASLRRQEPVLCASLALGPCLATVAFTPTPMAAGDSSGYYLYTPELHLLAETEISTAPTKAVAYSYLWFGDLPVASVEAATNTTRWYATDHLGTPLIQTSSSGAVVWRAEHAPYGEVFAFRSGATLHQPLRLPGQIAQDGSDAYYNVFRWYRAGWGRYTQADPLSRRLADLDLYAYVRNNPVNAADPTGLITLKRIENKHPLGHSPNGGGLTIAKGLHVDWTCTSENCRWKLNFVASEEYEMWAKDAATMIHEEGHVNKDWNNNLRLLSHLLPAEHTPYKSKAECDAAANAALLDARKYITAPPGQFWHDVKDFFTNW